MPIRTSVVDRMNPISANSSEVPYLSSKSVVMAPYPITPDAVKQMEDKTKDVMFVFMVCEN